MLFMGMGAAAGGAAWAREAPKSAGGGFFLRGICPINSVGCLSGFMVASLKGVSSKHLPEISAIRRGPWRNLLMKQSGGQL